MNEVTATVPQIRARARRRKPAESYPFVVKSLTVEDLFGKYSYAGLQLGGASGGASNMSVIVGDNGTGKTTLLKLLYASLSPEPSAGLRSIVARTPFRRFTITLADATVIDIKKKDLVGAFQCSILEGERRSDYDIEVEANGAVYAHDSASALEAHLASLGIDVLFVDHTRNVRSTYSFLEELSKEAAKRDRRSLRTPKASGGYEFVEATAPPRSEFPIRTMVNALHDWFRVRAFRQGTTGEQDASIVYLQVVKALSGRHSKDQLAQQTKEDLLLQVDQLQEITEPFVRHGLLSSYPFTELRGVISTVSKGKFHQVQAVLAPFLGSIQKRISALSESQRLISVYEDELNKYFRDKVARFHVLEGLTIRDDTSALDVDTLSSGEKQLVFLLSASLLSRDGRSLILIDEPELSLNYRWQRMIASSLSKIAENANTQFVLASHSIEIISRHIDTTVEL